MPTAVLKKSQTAKKEQGRLADSQCRLSSSPIPRDDVEDNEYDDSQRTDEEDDTAKAQADIIRELLEKVTQLEAKANARRPGVRRSSCEACRRAKIRCSASKVSNICLSRDTAKTLPDKPTALQKLCKEEH
jgi:hypothetical protein